MSLRVMHLPWTPVWGKCVCLADTRRESWPIATPSGVPQHSPRPLRRGRSVAKWRCRRRPPWGRGWLSRGSLRPWGRGWPSNAICRWHQSAKEDQQQMPLWPDQADVGSIRLVGRPVRQLERYTMLWCSVTYYFKTAMQQCHYSKTSGLQNATATLFGYVVYI